MVVKNRSALEAVGDVAARRMVLDIAETIMHALDSRQIIRKVLTLDSDFRVYRPRHTHFFELLL